jgi:Omp85 superfamily domain
MGAPPALALVCALAMTSSTGPAEPSTRDSAAQEHPPTPSAAVIDFQRADCSGNPHANAAGPPASCPQLDGPADRRPALDAPERDFPEWLGAVTGWWGPRNEGEDAPKKRHGYIITPIINSSPLIGVGVGAGIAGTVDFTGDGKTRPSKYSTSFVFTSNEQISVPLRADLTLPGGDWTAVLMWRWSKWPSPTWGLGGATPDSARATIDRNSLRLHQTVNRRLAGNLYAGAGAYLDYDFEVHDQGTAGGGPSAFSEYPYGTGSSSFSLGPGVRLVWDDRDSVVYPTRGVYANLAYAFSPTWLGSSNSWQSFFAEGRTYVPMSRRFVLALWTYGWFSFGEVPYLRLPSIGSEPEGRSGRGYIEGRHIGKALLYGEAELRVLLWEWLGASGGVNLHSVSQPGANGIFQDEPRFQYWYPALVAGLKIAVVKDSHANLNFDFAWGKASSGFYINFSESF